VILLYDHRPFVERISLEGFGHALEILALLSSCLLQVSDLFEVVFSIYGEGTGLCLDASYRLVVSELALCVVNYLYPYHFEKNQFEVASAGEMVWVYMIHHHPVLSLHLLL
jgi:hypothetical protein